MDYVAIFDPKSNQSHSVSQSTIGLQFNNLNEIRRIRWLSFLSWKIYFTVFTSVQNVVNKGTTLTSQQVQNRLLSINQNLDGTSNSNIIDNINKNLDYNGTNVHHKRTTQYVVDL